MFTCRWWSPSKTNQYQHLISKHLRHLDQIYEYRKEDYKNDWHTINQKNPSAWDIFIGSVEKNDLSIVSLILVVNINRSRSHHTNRICGCEQPHQIKKVATLLNQSSPSVNIKTVPIVDLHKSCNITKDISKEKTLVYLWVGKSQLYYSYKLMYLNQERKSMFADCHHFDMPEYSTLHYVN